MNIEKIFATVGPSIAKRGLRYFLEDKIFSLEKDKSTWLANVVGTKTYAVSLTFKKNGNLQRASCTCPCDYYCKHIAAVLFAILEQNDSNLYKQENETTFLMKENNLLQDLRNIFNRYSKGCDYWQSQKLAYELDNFLGLNSLSEETQFQLLKTFYGRLCTTMSRSDDSDGLLGDLLCEAAYEFNQLYMQTKNIRLKTQIEKLWFKWISDEEKFWITEFSQILEFWRTALCQSQRAQEVLNWLDKYEASAELHEKSNLLH